MKKPFLHAFGAALYIALIVTVIGLTTNFEAHKKETILIPMTMLSLFVLSAAVMGFLFLSEPLSLLVENKKQDAINFFLKTIGFFACFASIYAILVLFI